MAFCANCGQQLEDGAQFCANCGAQQNAAPAAPVAPAGPSFMDKVKTFFANLLDTPDHTASYNAADVNHQNSKLMSVLAYLSWLLLIPLFVNKTSAYTRFHTNQGIIVAIASTLYGIATGLVGKILGLIWYPLGAIFGWLAGIVGLVFVAYMVLGIVYAVTGKAKELPIVGKYRILD